jgi:hypothetical protein
MDSIGAELKHVKLKKLRPSQVTVGFREFDKKRRSWARLGPKDRREAMRQELLPAPRADRWHPVAAASSPPGLPAHVAASVGSLRARCLA